MTGLGATVTPSSIGNLVPSILASSVRVPRLTGKSLLLLLAPLLALGTSSVVTADPARAVAGDHLTGHRCRQTYPSTATKEDTPAALIDVSAVPGAWCEIDLWRISDGTMIVWHDATWGRVADPASLAAAGVSATDQVVKATAVQVSKIRTKGGEPVATFAAMIDASGAHGVPLLVELKNTVQDPASWVSYARQKSARVLYYKAPTATCKTPLLDQLRAAGAEIGFKQTPSGCRLTADQAKAKGASFVAPDVDLITLEYTSAMHGVGIAVYARGGVTATNAQDMLGKGADRLTVKYVQAALTW